MGLATVSEDVESGWVSEVVALVWAELVSAEAEQGLVLADLNNPYICLW